MPPVLRPFSPFFLSCEREFFPNTLILPLKDDASRYWFFRPLVNEGIFSFLAAALHDFSPLF